MKNIVVLGASNSRVPNSFYAGICGEDECDLKCYNLSVGASESLHKVYLLNNEKHKEVLEKADLLIVETNIMDYLHYKQEKVSLYIISKTIKWLYEELYRLNKRVLSCILFSSYSMDKEDFLICDLHEKLSRHYGFNFINFHRKMFELNLQDYCFHKLGNHHILAPIMYEFGKNVRLNFNNFLSPKKHCLRGSNPQFIVVSPYELNSNLNEGKIRDIFYNDEKIFWLKDGDKITFPKQYKGLQLLGIHTFIPYSVKYRLWAQYLYASLVFENKNTKIVKPFRSYNYFTFLYEDFFIDDETFIRDNKNEEMTETSSDAIFTKGKANTLTIEGGVRMVNFLLAKIDNKNNLLDENDLQLENSDFYDFTHLVPPIELYKDIIESFCVFNKLENQKQIAQKLALLKTLAKARIHNHLAYKLGQSMIKNSKTFLSYMKMPYILIALSIAHREEQKIKCNDILPPLESYPDYKEALKEKECFTYKLGLALMKANKAWYKGGYLIFFFKELPKLKEEFKRKKHKF